MTRLQWALAAVIAIEIIGGAVALARPRTHPVPPPIDLSFVDPQLAEELRTRAAKCNTPGDWTALGEEYLAYGYFPEGEACYHVAAEQDNENPERTYQWAFALERIGKLERANAEYERAVELGRSHPEECRYFIGRNYLRLERADEARAAFEAAGTHPTSRYERSRLLVRDGRGSDAVPLLETLTREYPQAIQPCLLRHRVEAFQNSPAAARFADLANRARGRLPTPFDKEWERLETTYNRLGLPGELTAIGQLVDRRNDTSAEPRIRAILAHEWNPAAVDLLAEVEIHRGKSAEAVRLLQDAIDREGPSVHLLERLGDAHELNGQMSLAVGAWTRASELGIGASVKNLHYRLAEHYEKAGSSIYARTERARAHLAAGHELFWMGKPRDARPLFEKATEVDPTLAPAWFYLGETDRLLGQNERARKAYERCLALDPDHGRTLAGLSLLSR